MLSNHSRSALAAAIALGLAASGLWAAATDTQVFTVTIPSVLNISGPADATITHDQSNSENSFSAQAYSVSANPITGATATFAVAAPFIHTTAVTFKRNCRLTVAVGSAETGSGWTPVVATDVTDYGATIPDLAAQVSAASTAPGDATLNLTVGFVTSDFSTLAAGSYTTTVTATIASN